MKSSLRLKPKTSLEKDEVQKMSTILMNLLNQHESIDFREPVDWQCTTHSLMQPWNSSTTHK